MVRYGKNNSWSKPVYLNGMIKANNKRFGDPLKGVQKVA